MPKLDVILQGKASDKGVGRTLAKWTKSSREFAEAAREAAKAGAGLGSIALPGGRGGGRGGGVGSRRSPTGQARRAEAEASRAATQATRARARESREAERVVGQIIKDARAEQRLQARIAREQRKRARQIENMTDAQLREVEIQREINRRRRKAARQQARVSLGADPTLTPKGKGRQALEFAENVAVVSGEFANFGAEVEEQVRGALDSFKRYEKGVREVSTLTDDIPIEQIEKITKDAALQFGGLPQDQVSAFYAIVSAGATDAASAQEQLSQANKLAIGGAAQQEEAVLAISKAVKNFGAQGVTATDAADSLFTAVRRGQTDVSAMARALPTVAQAAAGAGLSIDETNAALAVLSTQFPSASEGSTALRAALSNLSKPTKTARDEAERLGIDFSIAGLKAAGSMEEFLGTISEAEKFDENTLAKLFDSTEARSAVQGLITGMDDYTSVLADMESKQGAADQAFQKMADTGAQKTAQLEAQMEVLKITAGEALIPAMLELIEVGGPLIKQVTTWIKENPKLAAQLGKVAIGTAVAAKGAAALASGISMVSSVYGLAQSGMGMFGDTAARVGTQAAGATPKVKGLGGAAGKLGGAGGAFAIAAVAIIGFNKAMEQAEEVTGREQARLDKLNAATAEGGLGISFIDERGEAISDEQLLLERRNRLIDDYNAKVRQEQALSGQLVKEQLGRGSFFPAIESFGKASVGLLSGASGEAERQRRQAELDLARFDREFGQQLGIDSFEGPAGPGQDPSSIAGLASAALRQAEATEKLARSVEGMSQPWQGPSMEAGTV